LIGTDNTARKQIEADQKQLSQRLRDQQFYTRSLFESNIDALMTTDPFGIITDVNKQMEALTECTRDELIGSPFMSYFTDPESAETSIKLVLNKGTITNYELTARSRDGRETAVSYNATTLYDRARKLQGVFAAARDITDRKRMEDEIIGLSLTDELTSLNNRRGFNLLAEQEMKLAKRIKRDMLLFFSDVDKLKVINDSLGHAQGDAALKEVADILKETFREGDIIARIGGDEFVILALDASMESAEILTDRIQATLKRRNQQGDQIYQLSISIGIARYDSEAPCTISELIAQADGLMYHQKQTKKRKIVRISHQETTKGQIQ
jgi:diguanylate cyclase (GGDEF)-like protein/PAS domain S-box-containing protein